jgi:hypothetical protein
MVLSYEGCFVGISVNTVPDLIALLDERKGAEAKSLRRPTYQGPLVEMVPAHRIELWTY